MAENREAHLVELVDGDGNAVGRCTVAEAHTRPGRHHRAFSVLLTGPDGVLLQRRAAVKTRFPSRWSNTCCGHPAPGEPLAEAAGRRLVEEMGLSGVALREVGAFDYRAEDPATDRVEDEHDHVLVGRLESGTPSPDPDEVAEWRWTPLPELRDALKTMLDDHTPWLADVVRLTEATITGDA